MTSTQSARDTHLSMSYKITCKASVVVFVKHYNVNLMIELSYYNFYLILLYENDVKILCSSVKQLPLFVGIWLR